MHHGFALRYIPQVMKWTPKQEHDETIWLRLMSEYKYDSYQDFPAGSRFVESLLDWLQQFDQDHRNQAYELVRNHLIFISFSEMQHLVRRTFPKYVRPLQIKRAARKLNVPEYMIWSEKSSAEMVESIGKRSLFVGLSDGARLDFFRRANAGIINNEQFILAYEISPEKWEDLHKELKARTGNADAKFETLVLIDDFAGSGKTLIRWDEGGKEWKGKLAKINNWLRDHNEVFSNDCDVIVHHYIVTEKAISGINERLDEAKNNFAYQRIFAGNFKLSYDLFLSNDLALIPNRNESLDTFVTKYYDPSIMTPSLRVGGNDAKYGFAQCGLPLIMEHNTPNNSLALFWAESPITSDLTHSMRPLFRRRQRHY